MSKQKSLIITIAILSVFIIGCLVGATIAQSGAITITPESFSGDYSYLIETDGTYVWAKDGKTGQVVFGGVNNVGGVSGTNASAVIQSAINALPNGGKIFIKAGTYLLSNQLYIEKDNIALEGEGASTVLKQTTAGKHGLVINSENVFRQRIRIANLVLDGNYPNTSSTNGIEALCFESTFENIIVRNWGNVGINIKYTSAFSCGDNRLINIIAHNNRWEGILIQSNDNYVIQANCYNNDIGLHQKGRGGLLAVNVHCWGNNRGAVVEDSSNNIFVNLECEDNNGNGLEIKAINSDVARTLVTNGWFFKNNKGNTSARDVKIWQSGSYTVTYTTISNSFFQKAGDYDNYGIYEDTSGVDYTLISGCQFMGLSNPVYLQGLHSKVENNIGFITKNSGTATIPSSQTSVTVNHGLAGTPTVITVTPRDNVGAVWVSARNSTSFTITCGTAPSSNVIVDWYAEYKP